MSKHAQSALSDMLAEVPKGYEVRDERDSTYPTIEFRSVSFARLPMIQLRTVERSVYTESGYQSRRFWGMSIGSVSGELNVQQIREFTTAVHYAEAVMVALRSLEIESTPQAVLDAFYAEGLDAETVFEEKERIRG